MANHSDSPVFSPFTLGPIELPNRIVMAPLTRSRSDDAGVPPAFGADYYAQRATAGLLITEATNISPQAKGNPWTPGIWNAAQTEGWTRIVEAVHAHGGRIVMQLWHTGRLSHPSVQEGGVLPVAPSPIAAGGQAFTQNGLEDFVVPRELRTDEIPGLIEDYRVAAQNAKAAGFDGVEIHSANCYLLEQFVRDSTNRRTDEYGGSVENRLRLPLEVVRAVTEVWGADRVGIRLSPATDAGQTPLDSDPMGTYGTYVDRLAEFGLMYLHMIEGVTQGNRDAPGDLDWAELRRRFRGPYMANNLLTLELAEQALAAGDADLFAFGRPFIANPDLVERLKTGAPLAETSKDTWYGGGIEGYSDLPTLDGRVLTAR